MPPLQSHSLEGEGYVGSLGMAVPLSHDWFCPRMPSFLTLVRPSAILLSGSSCPPFWSCHMRGLCPVSQVPHGSSSHQVSSKIHGESLLCSALSCPQLFSTASTGKDTALSHLSKRGRCCAAVGHRLPDPSYGADGSHDLWPCRYGPNEHRATVWGQGLGLSLLPGRRAGSLQSLPTT